MKTDQKSNAVCYNGHCVKLQSVVSQGNVKKAGVLWPELNQPFLCFTVPLHSTNIIIRICHFYSCTRSFYLLNRPDHQHALRWDWFCVCADVNSPPSTWTCGHPQSRPVQSCSRCSELWWQRWTETWGAGLWGSYPTWWQREREVLLSSPTLWTPSSPGGTGAHNVSGWPEFFSALSISGLQIVDNAC